MILITGGAFQGKLECAKELFNPTCGSDLVIADLDIRTTPNINSIHIWNHLTDYMRLRMEEGDEPETVEKEIEDILRKNPDIVLVTREIGCGIVPMDAFDRKYREAHGRMCCRLAQRASLVYRVSCGVAQCIKGGL